MSYYNDITDYGHNDEHYTAYTKATAYDLTNAAITYAERHAYGDAHKQEATPENIAIWQTLNYISQLLYETAYLADEDTARDLINAIEDATNTQEDNDAEVKRAGVYVLENVKPRQYARDATTGYRYKVTDTNTTHPKLVHMD